MRRIVPSDVKLTSQTFQDGSEIPGRCGYKTRNVSPALHVSDIPSGTRSLALVMDDPDAMKPAGKVWVHWLVWDIDPAAAGVAEGSAFDGAVEGKTDFGSTGYGGPAPPDGRHTYVFKIYALDARLSLAGGARKPELEGAIKGHVIGQAVLKGTFAP